MPNKNQNDNANNAVVAATKPKSVELEAGTEYSYCTCGRSGDQPFCDGSHKGTGMSSMKFTPEKSGKASLCQCKQTSNPPYCDGSHRKLSQKDQDQDTTDETSDVEPTLAYIQELAREGTKAGLGPTVAMGVPRSDLPSWDDLQLLTAQLHKKPLEASDEVTTELIVGPRAKKPLTLSIPLIVSDMSYGALSPEAKAALAKGAQIAGTGICSGEGGMLPEEQNQNSRYFLEYASAGFGYSEELLTKVQAFHFKAGQAAKTGIGGHLPAEKVTDKIAEVRNVPANEEVHSPATFSNLRTTKDFKEFADRVREVSGGIPIGFKMSAQHIEADLQFALDASADYIILDGRGGATGAAPQLIRDNIGIPSLPAIARARRYLDSKGASDVTLIVTGGLRVPADFTKALALGANGIAVANSALQSIGCVAARICDTNQCPAGIATQKNDLRQKLDIDKSSEQLGRFFAASTHMMKALARACGHDDLGQFTSEDLTTYHKHIAELTGVRYAGVVR